MVPGSKGTSFRQHWAQIEKTLGRRPKGAPEQKDLPREVTYLWNTYLSLFTGQPLTFSEIKAYCELMQVSLRPFEVEALITLDRTMRS
ncbi:hypothetical protein [Salmonella phage PMBT28]|nr:hypothetical protein [Salmonella phage PMBT28]